MHNWLFNKMKGLAFILLGLFIGMMIGSVIKNFIMQSPIYYNCPSTFLSKEVTPILTGPVIPEKNDLKLLFVGVMTADKYIHSRAKAIYETWGKTVAGKLVFFTSETAEASSMPIIYLEGVDDSYPPQKKSFMMLKYMYDNLADKFEYFMRADDDLYVKTDQMELFLNSLNSSNLLYIGQAGQGTENKLGHLSLNTNENYCMGGPGMIFSRATLKKMGPHLISCLNNLKSTHEDVEIGRCVQMHVGIPCTWSYEMGNIFYHNNSGFEAFSGSFCTREVHQAITVHPLKNVQLMHKLHNYIQTLTIKEKNAEIVKLMREIEHLKREHGFKAHITNNVREGIFIDHLGSDVTLNKGVSTNEVGVQTWNYINQSLYELNADNPKRRVPSPVKEGITDSIREFMSMLNRVSNERGRIIEFNNLLYGYLRLHPTYAAEYIFDLLLTYKRYRGKKMTIPVRRHVYMQVPFGPLYIREAEIFEGGDSSQNKLSQIYRSMWRSLGMEEINQKIRRINFILPLAGRFNTFLRFIDDYEAVCLKGNLNCRLVLMLFMDGFNSDDFKAILHITDGLSLKYRTQIDVDVVDGKFSRGKALQRGAAKCSPDELLFFIDVDITFTGEAIDRIRWHTVRGEQAYYPIVFSEFKPDGENNTAQDHFIISDDRGYWRQFGYGIVSIFKSDMDSAGGFNSSITGWGGEDVDLFEKVNKVVRIFRAPDPSLVHVYHKVQCDPELGQVQYEMCEKTQYNNFAAATTLVKKFLKNPDLLEYLNEIKFVS